MTTRVRKDGGDMATDADISRAADTLRRGGLVAFPTETVYGLGADADNAAALARLYAVKGRPGEHPVIVHVGAPGQLDDWAADVSVAARRLADALWPGPLTIVVRRAARVLDAVTGGGDTVGVRVPGQPVALALLRAFGGGIAAPSANRFGHVSPTTAGDVRADLGYADVVVLDAPANGDEDAGGLYARVREADRRGVDVLLAVPPPDTGVGVAVGDRLRRAAGRGHS